MRSSQEKLVDDIKPEDLISEPTESISVQDQGYLDLERYNYSLLNLETLDLHKQSSEIEISDFAVFDSGTTVAYFTEDLYSKIEQVN